MKYGKDDKVDAEGIKKGMHDFINFLQKGNEENNDDNDDNKEIKENKDEQRLTRVSRLIMKNDGNTVNRLVLNKYKQKALEEYDCLDNQTLIQLKRILSFLNIDENNKNIIPVERIEQIINKHKSINLDKNEVIKYIHYLSCDDKPLEEITTININNTIFSEIDALLEEKLANEDIDIFDISDDDDEGKEDPLDLLDEVLQKLEATKENSLALKEMKNNLAKINKDYTETVNKFLEDNLDENQNENINNIEEMGIGAMEKMEKFDEFINDLTKDQKTSIKKIHSLKKSILAINKEMNQIKDDYKDIYEKYNNNQELDLNEEMERLYDENTALDEELKAKKEQISELINERAEKDNQINDLYIKLEEAQKGEKDLKKQLSDLKKAAAKNKEEYDNLMDNVLKKMEKKENEEIMERNRIKEMIEKQIQNEEDKKDGEKGQNEKFDFKALNDIDNMNISLTDKLIKKKKILSQLSSDQLMEYVLKLERLNINLKSEKNKKDQKIKELEEKLNQSSKTLTSNKKEIGSLNIEIKKLKNIISNLQNEVKTNEVFRPSKAMNSQIRISRISKLYTEDINARKFNAFKVENKIKNSNDYFKNMAINFSGKKPIKQTKLKDQNINQKLTKEQKTNFSPQNIINDIYND
jgi:exonuclease SbcC